MSNYDWSKPCGCQLMGQHRRLCEDNPAYERNVREDKVHAERRIQGFVWDVGSDAWYCRRGCGCVVWDVEAHTKNVCTSFNPVVGERVERGGNPTGALVHFEDLDGPACGRRVGFVARDTSQVTCALCFDLLNDGGD